MSFFTALPVPTQLSTFLANLQKPLPEIKWMHQNDYHLTLKYLGNPTAGTLASLQQTLASVPTEFIEVNLTHTVVFKQPNLHILVLAALPTSQLEHLHQIHEKIAVEHGVTPHSFPNYIPHVTLASYAPEQEEAMQTHLAKSQFNFPLNFTTSAIHLYSSTGAHGTGVQRYSIVAPLYIPLPTQI